MSLEVIKYSTGTTTLGTVLVAQSNKGVCAIFLGDPEELTLDLKDNFPRAVLIRSDDNLKSSLSEVIDLVDNPTKAPDFPIDLRGTEFQKKVWKALWEIPPGDTLSYSQLAERVGSPTGVRAVASACAANVLAVAVPCHRILRSDGSITGYRWGVERKKQLLAREKCS